MRVLVLGAAGFLGSRLAARLAADGRLGAHPIDELVLFDMGGLRAPAVARCKVSQVQGDVRDGALVDQLFSQRVDAVFHLAATLTVVAEADFRRGLETNVLGLVDWLERCRAQPTAPLLASVDKVIEGFLKLAALPMQALPAQRAMNLPGLTVTPAGIVEALSRRLPAGRTDWVDWRPDPHVQRIIDGWPKAFTSERALALGFIPDASADALVASFLAAENTGT